MAEVNTPADVDREWVAEVVSVAVGACAADRVPRAQADARLVEDLGYESINLVELTGVLEDLFDMSILSVDDAPPMGTVRDLQDYVIEKVQTDVATVPSRASAWEILDDL